jgi:hypothetical protein
MKRLPAVRGTSAAIVGALMLSAGGGYALASGSAGSSGTITACVHNRTHVLFMGRCRRGQAKLRWNKQGPQGPPGPIGATGLTGPSNGYTSAEPGAFFLGASNKTVDSVTVPAGAYVAFARVIPLQTSSAQNVHCDLIAPNGGQVDSDSVNLAAHTTATIVLQAAINTTTGGKVTVECHEVASSGVTVDGARIAAIKLGSVS